MYQLAGWLLLLSCQLHLPYHFCCVISLIVTIAPPAKHSHTCHATSRRCTCVQPAATTPAAPAAQRGADGHLTLGLSNDDFFRDPLAVGVARTGSGGVGTPRAHFGGTSALGGGGGGRGAGSSGPAVEPIAQTRFANAKAISSRCGAVGTAGRWLLLLLLASLPGTVIHTVLHTHMYTCCAYKHT